MFKLNPRSIEKLGNHLSKFVKDHQTDAEKRMGLAINIIYKTASAKRPMIGKKGKRVSDPAAPFGVAVAEKNGGLLKSSIKKEIVTLGFHVTGRVYVDTKDVPYAMRIEYGFIGADSLGRVYNQAPRPFMRPAWDLNKKVVEKVLLESNIKK